MGEPAHTREPVLVLRGIDKTFRPRGAAPVQVARAINLEIFHGETVALIGESGSGKSSLARIALGLLEPDTGEVLLNGQRINGVKRHILRRRRLDMQPVFQDSSVAFNPRSNVLQLIAKATRPGVASASEMPGRAAALLDSVGLRPGANYLTRYPHELSGGQRQRLAIARAISMDPMLIIADEPLSGADVSIRGQILNLLMELRESRNIAYMFITHDILIARAFAHRVAVMYRGEIVEQGAAEAVLGNPTHPYTRRLVDASVNGHPAEDRLQ
jgi:ABC-type glutathione transport system ATPase component